MRVENSAAMSLASEFHKHAKQRKRQTHCQAGHPFTPTNTREEVCVRHGKVYLVRICKACERARYKPKTKR
jgi:hypothetical protein